MHGGGCRGAALPLRGANGSFSVVTHAVLGAAATGPYVTAGLYNVPDLSPAGSAPSAMTNKAIIGTAVGAAVGGLLALLAAVGLLVHRRQRRRQELEQKANLAAERKKNLQVRGREGGDTRGVAVVVRGAAGHRDEAAQPAAWPQPPAGRQTGISSTLRFVRRRRRRRMNRDVCGGDGG
jgi:hypothetical protein